jgi:hypothetical protein
MPSVFSMARARARTKAAWRNIFEHRYPFGAGSESAAGLAAWKRFQPDVLYVHKVSDLELLETLLDLDIPIIRMVHDHDLYCMRSYKYNYFTRHICERALSPFCIFPCGAVIARDHDGALPVKWVSYTAKLRELELNRKFSRLIVATQFMKDELLRNQFDANQIEMHAPVPPKGDASWVSSFSDKNYIIYAGQIIRGKGVDVLLESLAQVRVPFTCFIFGDGQHRRVLRKAESQAWTRGPRFLQRLCVARRDRDLTIANVVSSLSVRCGRSRLARWGWRPCALVCRSSRSTRAASGNGSPMVTTDFSCPGWIARRLPGGWNNCSATRHSAGRWANADASWSSGNTSFRNTSADWKTSLRERSKGRLLAALA